MNKLPSLYNLTTDFDKLMELDTDDEINNALVAIVAGEIEQKSENICKLVKVIETTAEQFKSEEKRIADRRKALENKAARIRLFMRDCLLSANIDKLNAGTFKVSISTVGSCCIDDLAAIPAKYLTVIPEQYQPDKNAIKAAIKAGENVPGAHIEANFSMTIK